MATYFISETYLKQNTPVSQNVDVKNVLPNIAPAQDLHIQVLIEELYGETFFNHLLDAYSAQTLTQDEETLVSYIKPALAYKAAELSLPWIDTQVKNKGIQSQSGDFSAPVETNRMVYLRNELKNKAEAYSNKLVKYMAKYKSLYQANIVESETTKFNTNTFDSGFALYPECDN